MEIAPPAGTFFGFKSTINELSCRNNDIATALERNLHAGMRKKIFCPSTIQKHTTSTTTKSKKGTATMTSNDDELLVFESNHVVITRIGTSGEQRYEPGYVRIYAIKGRDYKGWIVSRNWAENSLNFSGIIVGGMPSFGDNKKLSVHFGKMPSTSYVNEEGKAIPTKWEFEFRNNDDYTKFFHLLQTFSHLGWVVNKLADATCQPKKLFPGKENVMAKKNNDNDISTDSSTNLLDTSDDTDDEGAGKYIEQEKKEKKEKKSILDDSIFSDDVSTSTFGSPIFAQSQDVLSSLGMKRFNPNDDVDDDDTHASAFSPLY